MRAVLVAVVLVVWATFVIGSVAMLGYLAVSSFVSRPPAEAPPGPTLTPSRDRIRLGRILAFGAVVGAVYGVVVGSSFVLDGNIAGFLFAAAPAIVFALLATVTSLHLRSVGPATVVGPTRGMAERP